MDQHGEHIILVVDDGHIVGETGGIHLTPSASQHLDDVIFQSIKIHPDVLSHAVVGPGRRPITVAFARQDGLHHRAGIEYRRLLADAITVIPFFHLVEVHRIVLAEPPDLLLGESEKRIHPTRHHHRVFPEIVQRRLRLVFLDWQNTCQIDARKDPGSLYALERTAQPGDVPVNLRRTGLGITANRVPLVDDQEKLFTRLLGYLEQGEQEAILLLDLLHSGKCLQQILLQILLDHIYDIFRVRESQREIGHIKIDHPIFVEMLLERGALGNAQIAEQLARVARLVIIGTQHFCRHGFTKTARTRDACKTVLREKGAVDHVDQSRLVGIFTVSDAYECLIAYIYVCSHDPSSIWR